MLSLIASKIKYLNTAWPSLLLDELCSCAHLWSTVAITFRTVRKEVCHVTNHDVNTTSEMLPHVWTFTSWWILISNGGSLTIKTIPMFPHDLSLSLYFEWIFWPTAWFKEKYCLFFYICFFMRPVWEDLHHSNVCTLNMKLWQAAN